MKIKAKAVVVSFSESPDFSGLRTFNDFESANLFLRELARNAPGPNEGYYKTDFMIVFEDGEDYKGRIDLTNFETPDLGDHVRKFVRFYSGSIMATDLPSHLTPEQYRTIVLRGGPERRDWMLAFLDHYQIGDSTPLASSDLTKAV